jgi:class 3 adenylate cyclase
VQQYRDVVRIQKEAATREFQARVAQIIYAVDVSELAPKVTAPTLVLHGHQDSVVPFSLGRDLASRLPNAHFVPLEGNASAPWETTASITRELRRFLGIQVSQRGAVPGDVHTILFTDIEGSTTLTQRLGDARAQELLRAHNAIVRDSLKACGGSEIKHTGDGIMASFPTASSAAECAVAIQRSVEGRDGRPDSDRAFAVRIGLNAGEPVVEEGDLFGTSVQLARRICDLAGSGQILVSNVVRELTAGKGFLFAEVGEVVPKGFEEPVRLYELRWRD